MPNLNEDYLEAGTTLASTETAALSDEKPKAEPRPALSMFDAIAVIVGVVVGAGIFRTPSLVAANVESGSLFLLTWVMGGLVSLIGALCYAELTTTFPHAGGDYHFLTRAFGKRLAFLFAWARMSVIQTGSIALLSFIIGDYMSQLYSFGELSSVIYAALVVVLLTVINIVGVSVGTGVQRFLLVLEVLGILIVLGAAFLFTPPETAAFGSAGEPNETSMGLAMVFVLLTFGGWNEAAYISAELKSGPRGMATALIASIAVITLIYLLINLAYLHVLGLEGMAASNAIAADLAQLAIGDAGMVLIGVIVVLAALTSANATILTGARTNYALGRDFPVFNYLGQWNSRASSPVNAYVVQGVIALALIGLALVTRNGFETMVEYTAPVFWFFLLLVGIALFVLRRKEPDRPRPFKVPLYPILPLIFCFTSAYLFYSSLMYTGLGALVGIGVLVVGVLVLLAIPRIRKKQEHAA
ncbi:APC family permease [Pontibacter ramchanderi]|uniref:Amino acid/polyamine/organocation transporter (APC superfamily) n=1 Tax=Pontibacter ramchanderi TaxID=1179743 RepID=A0A2N3U7E5_9BACT|nr:amino acid permease [Pontibacter ramchanderi]PKV62663.1 amino acid/polyamine/organocation transporter (APC superfamily) [Pontibacter ramchanderi]